MPRVRSKKRTWRESHREAAQSQGLSPCCRRPPSLLFFKALGSLSAASTRQLSTRESGDSSSMGTRAPADGLASPAATPPAPRLGSDLHLRNNEESGGVGARGNASLNAVGRSKTSAHLTSTPEAAAMIGERLGRGRRARHTRRTGRCGDMALAAECERISGRQGVAGEHGVDREGNDVGKFSPDRPASSPQNSHWFPALADAAARGDHTGAGGLTRRASDGAGGVPCNGTDREPG